MEEQEILEEQKSCTSATEEKKELVAVLPVLFESGQYRAGDILPAHNQEMVEAWLENGAAVWKGEKELKNVKARPVAAQSGMQAITTPKTSDDDLIGKIPQKKGRRSK